MLIAYIRYVVSLTSHAFLMPKYKIRSAAHQEILISVLLNHKYFVVA